MSQRPTDNNRTVFKEAVTAPQTVQRRSQQKATPSALQVKKQVLKTKPAPTTKKAQKPPAAKPPSADSKLTQQAIREQLKALITQGDNQEPATANAANTSAAKPFTFQQLQSKLQGVADPTAAPKKLPTLRIKSNKPSINKLQYE